MRELSLFFFKTLLRFLQLIYLLVINYLVVFVADPKVGLNKLLGEQDDQPTTRTDSPVWSYHHFQIIERLTVEGLEILNELFHVFPIGILFFIWYSID